MTVQPPKGLIDSTPEDAVFIRLSAHYAKRELPDSGIDSQCVFDCPRSQTMIRTAVKGTQLAPHFHSVCDEIVLVVGGSGEILVNGRWTPVKAGDLHVCPRGVVHGTRALDEDMQFVSVFTPHLPPGGDINQVGE